MPLRLEPAILSAIRHLLFAFLRLLFAARQSGAAFFSVIHGQIFAVMRLPSPPPLRRRWFLRVTPGDAS